MTASTSSRKLGKAERWTNLDAGTMREENAHVLFFCLLRKPVTAEERNAAYAISIGESGRTAKKQRGTTAQAPHSIEH